MRFRVHRLWQGCWRELEVEVVEVVVVGTVVEAMRHIRVVRVGVDLWVVCRGGELWLSVLGKRTVGRAWWTELELEWQWEYSL